MSKPNENVLLNVCCPKCGHTDNFLYMLTISCMVEDDGIDLDEHASFEYDENTEVDCLGCRYVGKLSEFNKVDF